MLNFLKTGAGFNVIYTGVRRYLRNAPAIRAAQKAGDHAKAQRLIRAGEDEFCDVVGKKLGITVEVIGKENIPSSGPFLIVANHQGYADIFAILDAFRSTQVGFIAKAELKKLGPMGKAIDSTGSLFLERGDTRSAIQTLNKATELLKQGYVLTIFPEGTRSHSNRMGSFKPGSFKFAQKAKVPVLPVTLVDSYKLFEEKKTFRPAHVKLIVHPLVPFGELDRKAQTAAAQEIEETIRNTIPRYASE